MRYLLLVFCMQISACSSPLNSDAGYETALTNQPSSINSTNADDGDDIPLDPSASVNRSNDDPKAPSEPVNGTNDEGDLNSGDFNSDDLNSDDYYSYDDPKDPFEPFNRTMWDFNYEVLDPYIFRPVAHAYSDYLYDGVKEGSNNMVQNLREPSTAVNHLLELNIEDSLAAMMRFLLNSTLGLAGYYDLAKQMGLERKRKDLSDILGKVGFSEGPYVMLPVLGPKTVREYVGDTVDKLYFPFSSLSLIQDLARWGIDGLYKRHKVIDQEELLNNAIDPYLFVKDAYLQHRQYKFYDGKIPKSELDNSTEAIPDEFLDELE